MRFVKLLTITVAAAAFIALISILPAKLCFEGAENYVFFTGDTSKNCREINAGGNAALKKLTLPDVCGECAYFSEFDLEAYLDKVNGKIVFKEVLSDSVNYYCKADLPYSAILYGEEINLHVCIKESGVKVASPIIFGGY